MGLRKTTQRFSDRANSFNNIVNLSTYQLSKIPKMGRGDVPCHIIGKVFDENQQIMDLIDELAAEKEQNKAQLQRILDKIYRNIARYGDASEGKQSVEAYVYDGWRGLLNTIKALLRLLGTDFVGARMCLFLGAELIRHPGVPK